MILFPGNDVFAHRVNLFCCIEDDILRGEGYYSGGRAAKNARITVYSLSNNELFAETKTDNDGRFEVQLEKVVSFKVIMNAGQGHKAEFVVDVAEGVDGNEPDSYQVPGSPAKIMVGLGLIAGIFGLTYLIKKRKNAF